uniref:Uncharacterized protein n=1 Tax=Rhizophora mucronata TaxID=61149 RepID=A0A2P2QAT3_RHIMU
MWICHRKIARYIFLAMNLRTYNCRKCLEIWGSSF